MSGVPGRTSGKAALGDACPLRGTKAEALNQPYPHNRLSELPLADPRVNFHHLSRIFVPIICYHAFVWIIWTVVHGCPGV